MSSYDIFILDDCKSPPSNVMWLVQALLEYERHKTQTGALQLPAAPILQPASIEKEVYVLWLICVPPLNFSGSW